MNSTAEPSLRLLAEAGFSFVSKETLGGHENMARDIDLLKAAERGNAGCRVYFWDGPWVSLGRFQHPEVDLVNPSVTQWVMRPTGGKAVLHGHDVTVGLAIPLRLMTDAERPGIKLVYTLIAQPLITALRECGMPAALAADTKFAGRGKRVADCFAHISPNDIVDEKTGVKVCGCALRLSQNAVLIQASIPFKSPLVESSSVIREAGRQQNVKWDHEAFAERLKAALQTEPI